MKGRKTIAVLTACLAVAVTSANAAKVEWSTGLAGAVQVDDSFVPDNSLLRLGVFDITDLEIQANKLDIAYLDVHFTLFAEGGVGDGAGDAAGFWAISSIGLANPSFVGKPIYLWVFNTSTLGSATEHGIFSATPASWVFPDDLALPPSDSTAIELAQVDQFVVGSVGPTLNFGTDAAPVFVATYRLSAIPEPTTALLVGMGLVGALAARRRK